MLDNSFDEKFILPRFVVSSSYYQKAVVSQLEFHQKLKQFFAPYLEAAFTTGQIDWNCVHSSRGYFLHYLRRYDLAEVYREFIFSLFEYYRCTDASVIEKSLEEFMIDRFKSYGYKLKTIPSPKSQHLEFLWHNEDYCCPWQNYQILRDYEGPVNNIRIPFEERHLHFIFPLGAIFKPFLFQDLQTTRKLLRYGATLCTKEAELADYMFDVISRLMVNYSLSFAGVLRFQKECHDHFQEIISEPDPPGTHSPQTVAACAKRRLQSLLVVIDAVTQMRCKDVYKHYRNAIESVRLLFKTTTQPLVTVPEISRFLYFTLDLDYKEKQIEDFCKDFLKEFPEGDQPLQPRKLQHLCRCRIRESLRETQMLPHGVWQLKIPKRIANYILIQKHEDEYRQLRARVDECADVAS